MLLTGHALVARPARIFIFRHRFSDVELGKLNPFVRHLLLGLHAFDGCFKVLLLCVDVVGHILHVQLELCQLIHLLDGFVHGHLRVLLNFTILIQNNGQVVLVEGLVKVLQLFITQALTCVNRIYELVALLFVYLVLNGLVELAHLLVDLRKHALSLRVRVVWVQVHEGRVEITLLELDALAVDHFTLLAN
jgi:hypothetical protein